MGRRLRGAPELERWASIRTTMRMISLFLLLFVFSPCFAGPLPIDSKNWISHPEIKHIRSIYNETEEAIKKGRFTKKPVRLECPSAGPTVQATFYDDSSGRVRKYQLSGGSDDSAVDTSYYYDKNGKLRFVFQSLRAVNGTDMETRTYFDEQGTMLYQGRVPPCSICATALAATPWSLPGVASRSRAWTAPHTIWPPHGLRRHAKA